MARTRRLFFASICLLCAALLAAGAAARYLSFAEVESTLADYAASGLPGSDIQEAAAWDSWVRTRDQEVRARIQRGIEDSISNLILYGTSFTNLPRLQSVEYAANAQSELTPAVKARAHALALALPRASQNERIRFVQDFLRTQNIPADAVDNFFLTNLLRLIAEQNAYQQKLKEAADDPSALVQVRGTLFESRGLSADASLLPNFALEETLRAMVRKGVLKPGSMKRIAIVGPGLDFADKRTGYDFYPLQTIQPFAVWESVAALGLSNAETLDVVCLDLNPAVIAHIQKLAAQAQAGHPYTIQLPRDTQADLTDAAVAYWKNFGALLGTPAKPLPVPQTVSGIVTRAVSIRPALAARLHVYNANIVTQTFDFPEGQAFDLIIATNILVYYDHFQQALAVANIARLLNSGGIFLSNTILPAQHVTNLEFLGRRPLAYTTSGAYGDDVVVYRKQGR